MYMCLYIDVFICVYTCIYIYIYIYTIKQAVTAGIVIDTYGIYINIYI
jgi:hypothetical protein